jgi:magnesium-transporting ATPase (P-type)
MEMQNFEEELIQMSKPEISQLKHQDMLANAITNAKDKSVLSWWWLCIPLYIIAALLMKSFFMPDTTLISNIHELVSKERYTSVLFFLIVTVLLIIFNIFSIRKIFFLSGSPKTINFLKTVWFNVLILILSTLILLIYSL